MTDVLKDLVAATKGLWQRVPTAARDLAGRCAMTWLAAFGATYAAAWTGQLHDVTSWSLLTRAAAAGVVAAVNLVVRFPATQVGNRATASYDRKPASGPRGPIVVDGPEPADVARVMQRLARDEHGRFAKR